MARTMATCTRCGGKFFVTDMIGTVSAKRGDKVTYMCTDCATKNEGYHATNDKVLGTSKVNNVYCGIEFESAFTDEYARNVMFEYGFIPTHDSSLESDGDGARYGWYDGNTCEYVSGLMKGLNRASKFALSCDRLIDENHMSLNDSCGTHFHVSVDSMKDARGEKTYMGYIRRFYNSLFVPLCEAMKENPEVTKAVFGRYFTDYAKSIDMNTTQDSHCDRYYFINCLADNNIEFRLNKFTSGKQYQNLMKMEVEMVKCIVKNFCEHFNDTPKDSNRYPNKTSYRKHKAQVTGQKLVELFKKFSNQ